MSTALTGLEPVLVTGFNGLYKRGDDDTCPKDHLTDCFNCDFPGRSQVSQRDPFSIQNFIANRSIISFFIATTSIGPVLLTLNIGGNFWDETHVVLLGNFPGAEDFEGINLFGRTYITFKSKGKALAGSLTYVFYFSGVTWILVPIAGNGPGAVALTLSEPIAGNVDVGVHNVSVSFENDRGFLSPPNTVVSSINSSGGKIIRVNNIPLGPLGTVARVLFMTPANQLESFFIPGGRIADNIITTFDISVFDTSLIASADYLNDLYITVPSGSYLAFYKGRLVIVGQDGTPDNILVSDISSPETFNKINNVIHFPVEFGVNTCSGAMVIRESLYITKPNGTYVTQDSGPIPATWPVDIIDSGVGAWGDGISIFSSSMSGQDVFDSCLIVNKRGVMLFDGTYGAIPLTYKIESLWQMISPDSIYKIHIAHDVWRKKIYLSLPLVNEVDIIGPQFAQSNDNKIILMGEYSEGLSPNNIKWSVWFTTILDHINKIAIENFTLNYASAVVFQLAVCGGTSFLFKVVPSPANDSGATIDQIITTGPIEVSSYGVSTFLMADLSISGNDNLNITVYGKGKSTSANLNPFNLSFYPNNIVLQRTFNFTSEKLFIKLRSSGKFSLDAMGIYGRKIWGMRPSLTQSL